MTKLDLDPDIGKSLASPNFKALSDYVDMFNKKNPERKTSLIDTLKLRYNKDFLPLNLQTAKDSSDEVTKAMATKLQIELLEQWRSNKKTAVDVFKILEFNFEGGRFRFDKTRFTILDDYIKLLNAKNSHENTQMLSVLKTGFGGEDKLALILSSKMESIYDEMYATAFNYRNFLFQEWVNRDLDPMSVLIKVFLVEEVKLTDAPAKAKAVIADYKPFYIKANSLDPDWLPKNV
ncbi:RxLR effector protein [Phytophthora megakarya]|uniref:RxLR effector protein n=1 Tax=Phytophthora megakarya TaxID=4795 RepID=A0A225UYK4_9STRA|nr:RxLR effector protein [Phytophthora megakarya]